MDVPFRSTVDRVSNFTIHVLGERIPIGGKRKVIPNATNYPFIDYLSTRPSPTTLRNRISGDRC